MQRKTGDSEENGECRVNGESRGKRGMQREPEDAEEMADVDTLHWSWGEQGSRSVPDLDESERRISR